MKTFIKNLSTIIVLSFQIMCKFLDMITLKRLVVCLKLDKFYLFIRDASLLDVICIIFALSCLYVIWKFIYFIIYVFQ